jgi:hypothetical protein
LAISWRSLDTAASRREPGGQGWLQGSGVSAKPLGDGGMGGVTAGWGLEDGIRYVAVELDEA